MEITRGDDHPLLVSSRNPTATFAMQASHLGIWWILTGLFSADSSIINTGKLWIIEVGGKPVGIT